MPRRLVATVLLGTLLNPLNTSMIAVALVTLREDFDVGLVTVTWLVSAFYLASAIGQPLAGRLADLLGPKRVFCAGWMLVAIPGVLAPFAPAFGWLVAARVIQALGTSCAFPAGLAILERASAGDAPPARTLAALNITNSVSAALGPVLGGVLVALAGWEAIFAVNAGLALVGLPLALRLVPADGPPAVGRGARRALDAVDGPGVVLFVLGLGSLLGWVLSLGDPQPRWWLLPVAAAGLGLLAWWEPRRALPLLDLAVARDRRLLGVFASNAALNLVFYSVFFGVPQWLEDARGFSAGTAGLLLLPVAGLGVLVTPVAARMIGRRGPRPALLVGSAALAAGTAALQLLGEDTPVALILLVAAVLGLPNGFNNLGLQSALYAAAPPGSTGAASGLFMTSRFLGAIAATALIGLTLGDPASSDGLHAMALVGLVVALLVLAAGARRPTPTRS